MTRQRRTLTELIKGSADLIKNITVLVTLCISLFAGAMAGANFILERKLDSWWNDGVKLEFLNLKEEVKEIKQYNEVQIVKNILKQYDKITKGNFDDIKTEDIEDALIFFPTLNNPEPNVIKAMEVIQEYYYKP